MKILPPGLTYYVNGLRLEDVPLVRVANTVGTPAYCYTDAGLRHAVGQVASALPDLDCKICYSVKANGNVAVLRTLAGLGCCADVVSGGELRRALAAGITADRIVFSGVGKSVGEIEQAIEADIHQINVESEAEAELVRLAARRAARQPSVAIRINPNIDALTHPGITTGKRENKFGIDLDDALSLWERAASWPEIRLTGVAVHIGSQITQLSAFLEAFRSVASFVDELRRRGYFVDRLDLGGGLAARGVQEGVSLPSYAAAVSEIRGRTGCQIILEPGRLLVANAGLLLTKVLYVKRKAGLNFLIVDAGMNDLIRPALYGAHHDFVPELRREHATVERWEIAGPVCESTDVFAHQRDLPTPEVGDLIAVLGAGAYGAAMSSAYNARSLPPEVLVKDGDFAVVRRRVTVQHQLEHESLAPWHEPAERLEGAPSALLASAAIN